MKEEQMQNLDKDKIRTEFLIGMFNTCGGYHFNFFEKGLESVASLLKLLKLINREGNCMLHSIKAEMN